MATAAPLPRHVALLLDLLLEPGRRRALVIPDWELVVRVARRAKLAATLHARLGDDMGSGAIPARAADRLASELAIADYQNQMVRVELRDLARVLAPLRVPVVLLKGAAFLLQQRPWARGRLLGDIDIMVPRERIDAVEHALVSSGWESEVSDPYDQRYYRQWSHELPPMRRTGSSLELDVHHSILPLTGRLRPDPHALLEASAPIPGTPFRALHPADQILHGAAHLFQDSDCIERLRDLWDLHAMLAEFAVEQGAWRVLLERAEHHQLQRPLWYTLRYAQRFFRTAAPDAVLRSLQPRAPHAWARWTMDRCVEKALVPVHPDVGPSRGARLGGLLLYVRSVWLRMPPLLLAGHLLRKAWRRMTPASRGARDADSDGQADPGQAPRAR